MLPGRIAIVRNKFADGIYRWLSKPDSAICAYGEKQRSSITPRFCIILYEGKVLTVILRNITRRLLRAANGCGIAARFSYPDIAACVKAYTPWNWR